MSNLNHSIKDNSMTNQNGSFFNVRNQSMMNHSQYHHNYPNQSFSNPQNNTQRSGINGLYQMPYANPTSNQQNYNQGNMIPNQQYNMTNAYNQQQGFNSRMMMGQNMPQYQINTMNSNSPSVSINNQPKIAYPMNSMSSPNNVLNLPLQMQMYSNNQTLRDSNNSFNGTQSPNGISMTVPNNQSQITQSSSMSMSMPSIKITNDGGNCQGSTSRSPNISSSGSPSSVPQFYPGGYMYGNNNMRNSPSMSNDILKTPQSQFANTSPVGSPNTIGLSGFNFGQMSPSSPQINSMDPMKQLSPISGNNYQMSQSVSPGIPMNNSPLPESPNQQNQFNTAYNMQLLSQMGKQQQQLNHYQNQNNPNKFPIQNNFPMKSIVQTNTNNYQTSNSFLMNTYQRSNTGTMHNQRAIPNKSFKHNVTVKNDTNPFINKKFGSVKLAKSDKNVLNRLNSLPSRTTTENPLSDKFPLLEYIHNTEQEREHNNETVLIMRFTLENNHEKIIEYKRNDNLKELLLKELKSEDNISDEKFNFILSKIRNVLDKTFDLYEKTMTINELKKAMKIKHYLQKPPRKHHRLSYLNIEEDILDLSCDNEYNDYLRDFCHCLSHDRKRAHIGDDLPIDLNVTY